MLIKTNCNTGQACTNIDGRLDKLTCKVFFVERGIFQNMYSYIINSLKKSLLEVKLPYEPVCPSYVGSVFRSVLVGCHNFLKCQSTCCS